MGIRGLTEALEGPFKLAEVAMIADENESDETEDTTAGGVEEVLENGTIFEEDE